MPKPHRPVLNDFTREHLAAARARILEAREPAVVNCAWCESPFKARVGQKFCKTACRVAYAAHAARISYEAMIIEREHWHYERQELTREVSRLRALCVAAGISLD